MIHPATRIHPVNPTIGLGVFARTAIPRGTIVVARDPNDLVLEPSQFDVLPPVLRAQMVTYMYRDKWGRFVLNWDHAKYMNHSCHANTMMTDYGVEIAVRDICSGEEITTEYGLLNIIESYAIDCGCPECRGQLRFDDIDRYGSTWDVLVKESLLRAQQVSQPLWDVVVEDGRRRIMALIERPDTYSSVMNLKCDVAPEKSCLS